jgi:hypothetical protein
VTNGLFRRHARWPHTAAARPKTFANMLQTASLEMLTTTRQCAWCWLVADSTGVYRIAPGRKIKTATRGSCGACKEVMLAEINQV